MKTNLLLAFMTGCALSVGAQGTMEFSATLTGGSEVPPNSDPTVGTATFSLTGTTLQFAVFVPAVTFQTTDGTINGPSLAGASAPAIFDLGLFTFHPGNSFGSTPYYAAGAFTSFTLTDPQITELTGGLWYVNIVAATAPFDRLRGQITLVPEPATLSVLALGAALLLALGAQTHAWRRSASRSLEKQRRGVPERHKHLVAFGAAGGRGRTLRAKSN